MEQADVRFTRRQVREVTGWNNTQLYVHLSRLVELEYLLTHRADHGQGFVYELVYDAGGKEGGRFISGLIDVEKLRAECDYDEKRSGSERSDSGPVRPSFGPDSGLIRAAEIVGSSSVDCVSKSQIHENALPGPDAKDAAA